MTTWTLRHVPLKYFDTIVVNKSNNSRAREMAIEHVSRGDSLMIDLSETDSTAEEGVLLHSRKDATRKGIADD